MGLVSFEGAVNPYLALKRLGYSQNKNVLRVRKNKRFKIVISTHRRESEGVANTNIDAGAIVQVVICGIQDSGVHMNSRVRVLRVGRIHYGVHARPH
jgi:hypothetical protein